MRAICSALVALLVSSTAGAEPCVPAEGKVCLPKDDFQRFLDIAVERQCLERTKPSFKIDQIVIMTDTEGRVFYTGADPKKPYTLKMTWCHYEVEAKGAIELVAAMQTPELWGFRFRPKAYLGYLPLKLTRSNANFESGIDAGMLIEWFFYDWVNLNVAAGFRSVGLGGAFDLTQNFGAYVGYGIGWTAPLHNVNTSIYFAF